MHIFFHNHSGLQGREINLKVSSCEEQFFYAEWLESWWPHSGGKKKWSNFQVENAAKDVPTDIMAILSHVLSHTLYQREAHSFLSTFECNQITNQPCFLQTLLNIDPLPAWECQSPVPGWHKWIGMKLWYCVGSTEASVCRIQEFIKTLKS